MKTYILVHDAPGYHDDGGGVHYEEFDTLEELDKAVANVFGLSEILAVGELRSFQYEAKEVVTKVERIG